MKPRRQFRASRSLLKRLFFWSSLILVAMLGILFVFELESSDRQIVEMVQQEAQYLQNSMQIQHAQDLSLGDPTLAKRLKHILSRREAAQQSYFILIELYDPNHGDLADAKSRSYDSLAGVINRKQHQFPQLNDIWYQKILSQGRLLLQAVVPMTNDRGQLIGYFEGIYEVGSDLQWKMISRIALDALTIIIVVFSTTFLLYPTIRNQENRLKKQSSDLLKANLAMLKVLGNSIAKRDSDTDTHNYRVTVYALKLGRRLKCSQQELQKLVKGAFLHDVGKIGVPDAILLKPGKLDDSEFSEMKKHVDHGQDIIAKSNWLEGAREIVSCHHEKFDGSGYPKGLSGKDIPLGARIFAIVDVFDALTSKRPYKDPFPMDKAIEILQAGKGQHFDPEILDLFLQHAEDDYQNVYLTTPEKLERWLDRLTTQIFQG